MRIERRPRWPAVIGDRSDRRRCPPTLGTPALSPQAAIAQDASQPSREQIDAMIAQVKQQLEKEPNNVEGWRFWRARHDGQFQAAAALCNAQHVAALRADLLADYADALAMSQGRSFAGKPMEPVAGAEDRSDPMEGARDGRLGSVRPQGLQGCRRVLAALTGHHPARFDPTAHPAASTKRALAGMPVAQAPRAVRRAAPRRPQRQRDGHAEPNPRIESAA